MAPTTKTARGGGTEAEAAKGVRLRVAARDVPNSLCLSFGAIPAQAGSNRPSPGTGAHPTKAEGQKQAT